MSQAFIIMQIGNPVLDEVYKKAIFPAISDGCGLDARRVDKHNQGGLLISEIVEFIQSSDIIIAALTNERPNCYLEVGYAMGLDKFRNLILTCREDHHHDSPNYKKDGPKVHFDLSGYDILFWDPQNLSGFADELIKRVKRRLATLLPVVSTPKPKWDEEWITKNQHAAFKGLKSSGHDGFMEVNFSLPDIALHFPQNELLSAASEAEIHTFGWPIGVVLCNRDEFRPKPITEGIVAEIDIEDRSSYDYWAIKKNGAYYLLKSLFEDLHKPRRIFFNTRIVRITETFLYAVRLYNGLKVPNDSRILISFRHGGLKGRILSAVGSRQIYDEKKSIEDEVYAEVDTRIDNIESKLVELVQQIIKPLFVIFDYTEFSNEVVEDIVNNFVNGKVT